MKQKKAFLGWGFAYLKQTKAEGVPRGGNALRIIALYCIQHSDNYYLEVYCTYKSTICPTISF